MWYIYFKLGLQKEFLKLFYFYFFTWCYSYFFLNATSFHFEDKLLYQLFACPSEQSSWYIHIVDFNCLHSLLVVFNVCDMEFYARTVYVRVKTKSKSIIVRFFSIFNFNLGFFYKCFLRLSLFFIINQEKIRNRAFRWLSKEWSYFLY